MKLIISLAVALFSGYIASAQTIWHNPQSQGATIHGQALQQEHRSNYYNRLPDQAKESVRKEVWNLSTHCAGEKIKFYTNSPNITVKYITTEGAAYNHMPATGKSGLDLYAYDSKGNMLWCASEPSRNFGDTTTFSYNGLAYNTPYPDKGYKYELYLPLYNGVKWMEIGIDKGSSFEFINAKTTPKVVVYGTSITQGAVTSRAGMAWTNIVSRDMNIPIINLGFSGNGRLEDELLDIIASIDAECVILDCIPNLDRRSEQEISTLTVNAVKKLRSHNPNVAIIITDHYGYPNNKIQSRYFTYNTTGNKANTDAIKQLKAMGYKDIHHLSAKDIAMPLDATVEAVHPSDWGMRVYANAYIKILKKVLH